MTDNSVEMRRLREYFDIELLREKQYSEYVIDRLKKEIRDLKVERDKARKERNQARSTAESYRKALAVIGKVRNMPQLPWEVRNENV